ncbi:MAG: hypothetical protein DHS20C18_10600 [Saprospiraceae bacterium]|nr:MAG: hypothetical protein DHS20C18_10600 [Saprospiraceae bacterium]
MRFLFLLFLLTNSLYRASASDTIFSHTFTDDLEWNLTLSDSMELFLDQESVYNIEEVLQLSAGQFTRPDQEKETKGPITVWSRIQLFNAGAQVRYDYFHFCTNADSLWVYTVENGRVIEEQFTGSSLKPKHKSLPAAQNYIPYNLEVGEQKIYYFKIHFAVPIKQSHLVELFIKPGQALIHYLVEKYAWQSFYAGILLLFCLVSLFMYGMFRERVFIYYAFLMLFFSLYFLLAYGIVDVLFTYNYPNAYLFLQRLFISGIVISFFLFLSKYIRLLERFPLYFKGYLFYSVFVAVFAHLAWFFSNDEVWISKTINFLLIPWVVITMIPIFLLLRKRDKAGGILLTSIALLFIGSLLFILGVSGIIPVTGLTKYGIQVGVVLFSGMLFYGLFDKINTIQGEKQKFKELDKLKSRFFANISHEFRTPLTLVMGPLSQVMEKEHDPEDQKLLKLAHRNAGRLLQLINQLLDLSKLEAGKMQLKVEEKNFALLLKGIVMSFESLAARKNIRLHFVSQKKEIFLYINQDKVEKIFYNLLSNAFKFTPEQGEVAVMVTEQDKFVEIIIRDNGVGIPAERLPHIFNRFFQVDSSETREQEGTGIGLALVRELIHLHSGSISVESKVGIGTTFIIHLPKGTTHLKENEIGPAAPIQEIESYLPDELIPEQSAITLDSNAHDEELYNDLPLVLIIEDNADVRAYIKHHLASTFKIMEAINGQHGIDMALEHIPDLVISDVMMPKKDGYEVCQTLKTDQRTSHIPVILLTAKAAQEEKMKGLEIGADDYLVKPFDTKELEIRVRNLIELRQQLHKRYSDSTAFEPQTLGTNAVDKAFLEKIGSILEAHLANEQFSVEILAEEMGMSRVHLNRKLKALTDESANKFIRSFRLQKAYQMLQQRAGNVTEIAFATGFSSTAYFVKCFGDKYGQTPGSFL